MPTQAFSRLPSRLQRYFGSDKQFQAARRILEGRKPPTTARTGKFVFHGSKEVGIRGIARDRRIRASEGDAEVWGEGFVRVFATSEIDEAFIHTIPETGVRKTKNWKQGGIAVASEDHFEPNDPLTSWDGSDVPVKDVLTRHRFAEALVNARTVNRYKSEASGIPVYDRSRYLNELDQDLAKLGFSRSSLLNH